MSLVFYSVPQTNYWEMQYGALDVNTYKRLEYTDVLGDELELMCLARR
jgi:hypothetical protein